MPPEVYHTAQWPRFGGWGKKFIYTTDLPKLVAQLDHHRGESIKSRFHAQSFVF